MITKNIRRILSNIKLCSYVGYLFCMQIGLAINQLFIADLAKDQGFTQKDVSFAFIVAAALNIVNRVGAGYLFDRPFIKKHRAVWFAFIGFGYGCSLIALSFPSLRFYFYLKFSVTMFFSSIHFSQYATILTDGVEPERFGEVIGFCRFVNGFGFVIGQVAGGE